MRYLAVLLACALSGCQIFSPSFESLAERPWVEVRSPTARVLSDVDLETATELLDAVEVVRGLLDLTLASPRDGPLSTDIVAFTDREPIRELYAKDHWVYAFAAESLRRRTLIVKVKPGSADSASWMFAHLYAHVLMHEEREIPYPFWFDYGYRSFISAIHLSGDPIILGTVPPHFARIATRTPPMAIRRVLRTRTIEDWPAEDVAAFRLRAWQLVHYLLLAPSFRVPEGRARLERYLRAEAKPDDVEREWREAFGSDVAELASAINQEFRRNEIRAISLERSRIRIETERSTRLLRPAEVQVELGWTALAACRAELACALFERALAREPEIARAHAGMGRAARLLSRWELARDHLERALQLAPDDFESHLEFAEWAFTRPTEPGVERTAQIALARAHFERAIALAPKHPEAHALLAKTYLAEGEDPARGIPFAQRAAQILPGDDAIQLILARLYAKNGDTQAARRRLERIVARSHTTVAPEVAEVLAELDARERNASAPAD